MSTSTPQRPFKFGSGSVSVYSQPYSLAYSLIRPEATGYGTVYFAREMLSTKDKSFQGARVAISGSGNVAQFAAEKVLDLGGKPVTLSDSSGFIYDSEGIDRQKLAYVMDL